MPYPTYTTHIEYDMDTMIPLTWTEEPYDGEWGECKKGREAQAQLTQQDMERAQQEQATRQAQLDSENSQLKNLDTRTASGLSQAAESQLGQDKANIHTTYNNARATGLRALAQRGMAGAPTGAMSSLMASADRGEAMDDNAAFNQAQQNTRADTLASINARQGLQQIYNPNQSAETASQSAYRQSQMGSTLGDIGAGIEAAAGLATGGYNLANAVSKRTQSSGMGGGRG